MLDFNAVKDKKMTWSALVGGLTRHDLAALTNEMIDQELALIADCVDEDVVFQPVDPDADDPYAANSSETQIAWTLGHVIVHATASSEESAFLAAEMARGVDRDGRSRYETPWETVTTIAQCRARLEESRRMRHASLAMWPDEPHMDLTRTYPWMPDPVDATGRFVLGLWHEADHLGQIAEIVRQAQAARQLA